MAKQKKMTRKEKIAKSQRMQDMLAIAHALKTHNALDKKEMMRETGIWDEARIDDAAHALVQAGRIQFLHTGSQKLTFTQDGLTRYESYLKNLKRADGTDGTEQTKAAD